MAMALPQEGGVGAGGGLSRQPVPEVDVLVLPDDAPAGDLQAHPGPPEGQPGLQARLPHKVGLAQLHGEVQAGLQGAGVLGELMSIEGHGGLQPQGVPGPQAAGDEAQVLPGVQQQSHSRSASALAQ